MNNLIHFLVSVIGQSDYHAHAMSNKSSKGTYNTQITPQHVMHSSGIQHKQLSEILTSRTQSHLQANSKKVEMKTYAGK